MASITEKRKSERTKLEGMAPSDIDSNPEIHGILLSDQITFFANQHGLIKPFDPENLKPAGYELTVGNEYFKSGEYLPLKDRLTLLPFEVAVIKTGEIICLPRYLIARWNIRVKHAYQGLLWVGGPQVDPGYVGHLFCPIYNLSDILGGGTIAISIWAILLALFSYLQWRMVRLVGERYGTLMANRASDARRILKGWWWKGMFVSVLLALAAGIGGFYILDPFIAKMRQQQLMTKDDLEGSYLPLRKELQVMQDRLRDIENSTVSRQEFDVLKGQLRQPKAIQPPG